MEVFCVSYFGRLLILSSHAFFSSSSTSSSSYSSPPSPLLLSLLLIPPPAPTYTHTTHTHTYTFPSSAQLSCKKCHTTPLTKARITLLLLLCVTLHVPRFTQYSTSAHFLAPAESASDNFEMISVPGSTAASPPPEPDDGSGLSLTPLEPLRNSCHARYHAYHRMRVSIFDSTTLANMRNTIVPLEVHDPSIKSQH